MFDFYPSLCELAGLSIPQKLEGASIVPQLRDAQSPRDRPAYSVLRHGKTWGRAIYTERYRYTEWGDDAAKGVELYDHQSDPKEYTNLAKDAADADVVKELKTALDRQIQTRDSDTAAPSGD